MGFHHFAFHVEKHEQVDQVHLLGAQTLDGPAEFAYGGPDGWYAVYFLGPDRLKFEVVHMPAAEKAYTEAMRALERGTRDSRAGGPQFVMQFPVDQMHLPQVGLRRVLGNTRPVFNRLPRGCVIRDSVPSKKPDHKAIGLAK